jgi:hypothetical protein
MDTKFKHLVVQNYTLQQSVVFIFRDFKKASNLTLEDFRCEFGASRLVFMFKSKRHANMFNLCCNINNITVYDSVEEAAEKSNS